MGNINSEVFNEIIASEFSEKVGVVVSSDLLGAAVLVDMSKNVERLKNKSLDTGIEKISFICKEAHYDSATFLGADIADLGDGIIKMASKGGMQLVGSFMKDDAQTEYSDFLITVKKIEFDIGITEELISIDKLLFECDAQVSIHIDRELDVDISEESWQKLKTLEAWMEHFGPQGILSMFLDSSYEISINEVVSSFEISAPMEIEIFSNSLVIFPSEVSNITEQVICPAYDSTTGMTIGTSVQTRSDSAGTITWDMDIQTNQTPIDTSTLRDGRLGEDIGVYIPASVVSETFRTNFPAISTRIKGRELLRYDGWLTTKISDYEVTVDPQSLGVKTYLEFDVDGHIDFTAKIECIGEVDIGNAKTETVKPLKLWLNTVFILENGKLVSKTSLGSMKVPEFNTKVFLFSRYLSWFGGKAAVVGWALDLLAGSKVSYKAMLQIRKKVKRAFNKNNFVLLDLGELVNFLKYGGAATFSGESRAMLVGVGKKDD